jgi:AcrR family transcriptional regulator
MQIKKKEIRDEILAVAEKEFLKRGFKNSSIRTIATKSHTTLGNIYHYFENKEAILDGVIGDIRRRF